MNYRFPQKVQISQNSLIRDVAEKGSKIPGFISFAMGNPAEESIPVELLKECVAEVYEENPMGVLQYGPMSGYQLLGDWVKERLVMKKGCPADGNQVLLLAGSGKALGLVPRTLVA